MTREQKLVAALRTMCEHANYLGNVVMPKLGDANHAGDFVKQYAHLLEGDATEEKTVKFVAKPGGDGECFLFRGATEADRAAIVGDEQQARDRQDEEEFQREFAEDLPNCAYTPEMVDAKMKEIYPETICRALGLQDDKFYLFTITAEQIPE